MYKIKVFDYFSSAHQLNGYQGKCEDVHGHNWKVEVEVQNNELNNIGLLMDFKELKAILKDVTEKLDHKMLNNIDAFKDINPSSEIISKYIYEQIQKQLPPGVKMLAITVWESVNSCATYFED